MQEEMEALELMKQRETEAYEELGRMPHNDPGRKEKLNEATRLTETRLACEKSEQDRLNSYAKNELDERRLDVEETKVKTDQKRVHVDGWKAVLYVVSSFVGGITGYVLNGVVQNDKRFERMQDKLSDCINRK